MTTQTHKDQLAYIHLAHPTWDASKVLSALGHPGYGDWFAQVALKEWARDEDRSLHSIVYMDIG